MIDEARNILPPKIFSETKRLIEEYSEKLEEAAKTYGIDKEVLIQEIRRRVIVAYKRAVIEPGEPIGTVTAQSLGEPTTQMVLRTFHFAGIAKLNVTLGLPRLKEILDNSKKMKTPIMTVYLKEKPKDEKDRERVERIAMNVQTKIERLSLRRLVKSLEDTEILEDVELEIPGKKKGKKTKSKFPLVGLLKVRLDLEAIKKRRNIKDDKKAVEEVKKLLEKLSDVKLIEADPNDDEVLYIYVVPKKENIGHDELADIIEKVYTSKLSGIENVRRGIIERDEDKKEFIIRFEGSNILEVMKIPEVDETRVTTNVIREIESVLGIEAARNAIIHEMRYTMKESGNLYVDVRHYMLLADAMTRYGMVLGITRQALIRYIKKSPIGRASFEIPYKFIADAAKSGEKDPLVGVNESIIVGNIVKLGTGKTELRFNLFEIAKFKEKKEE